MVTMVRKRNGMYCKLMRGWEHCCNPDSIDESWLEDTDKPGTYRAGRALAEHSEPGMQLLLMPAQVISTARTCNLILVVLDCLKPISHKKLIEHELEGFGIRLNKQPPGITFRRKEKGGLSFTTTVSNPRLDLDGEPSSGNCARLYVLLMGPMLET